ncbi:aminopeptidase P family N-terminal domain-containing protein [Paraburkholderia acidisoli]|uniref:Creatinase N-terminal domain-containing protein n=1 Tax=Paraburkholderia acidisoli TaxID=2571748 RepID=A0A7Z2GQP1_9BURK|nr:aminopeptidase P family N-terminal domain-containing protein [Paraburkholderia acidisoli]QGZ66211.1 hypothetical protein FAZ98_30860 [Paraburkholderia acidisoli]
MRRGLIGWDHDEVAPAVLERRVQRVQQAMREQNIDAILAYTSFAQPSAVQWLTHFVPYWSEALAVLTREGQPTLLASLTQRVHPWIREVSHLADVKVAPRLGDKTVEVLREAFGQSGFRMGVIGLDTLPWSVGGALIHAFGADAIADASELYAALRQPADEAEIALARRAIVIGTQAMAQIPADATRASDVLSAVDRAARWAGAEEVLLRIAPDYRDDAPLRRMESDAPLGERYALEISVAYKGAWVRLARCFGQVRADRYAQLDAWFAAAAARFEPARALPAPPEGEVKAWTFEACSGVYPLEVVATQRDVSEACAPGTLGTLSVECALADGPWRASATLLTGSGIVAPATV